MTKIYLVKTGRLIAALENESWRLCELIDHKSCQLLVLMLVFNICDILDRIWPAIVFQFDS